MMRLGAKGLALLSVSAIVLSPSVVDACSPIGFPATRASRRAHIIGTSTTDSIFAGPGSVRYVVAPGHSGPGRDRSVFGQVVSVERIGGLAAAGLRKSVDRVVLVPWDYAADCIPTPWPRSALWVEPGTRGLFTATLRDSAHWTGGLPTFDITAPEFQPYPQQVARHRGRGREQGPVVSADTLFDLMELFPDERLMSGDSAEAAVQPLFAWARAHVDLASRYPMNFALSRARSAVASARMRRVVLPFRGTWRFTITTADAPSRTFHARTGSAPVTGWMQRPASSPPAADPASIPAYDGYSLLLSATLTPESLPTSCMRGSTQDGYMSVLGQPTDSAGRRVWSAKLELDVVARVFPGDSSLARFARDDFEEYQRRSVQRLPVLLPIRFTETADGVDMFEQVNTTADGRKLLIQGTRVSTTTTNCTY